MCVCVCVVCCYIIAYADIWTSRVSSLAVHTLLTACSECLEWHLWEMTAVRTPSLQNPWVMFRCLESVLGPAWQSPISIHTACLPADFKKWLILLAMWQHRNKHHSRNKLACTAEEPHARVWHASQDWSCTCVVPTLASEGGWEVD